MSYHFGLLLGMLTGMLAGIVLVAILFKKKVLDMHFDERQELARGKAFQYGFLTLVVCLYAYGATELAVGHWCDVLAGVTICIALSMGVFAVTCICRDAYLSFREKPKQIITAFAILSAVNLGFGAMSLLDGTLTEDGVLTFRAVNPIAGVLTLFILIVYIVRNRLCRNGKDE